MISHRMEDLPVTPTLLLYNLDNEHGKKLRLLCASLKIRVKSISSSDYTQTVGALAGIPGMERSDAIYNETGFTDAMLVFKDFNDPLLDRFLVTYRKMKLPPIPLKAVLTGQNIAWTSLALHDELVRESRAIKESSPASQ